MDDETSGDRVKAEQLAQVDASEGGETAKKFPSFFQNGTFALAYLLFEVASPNLKPCKRSQALALALASRKQVAYVRPLIRYSSRS